MDHAGSGGLSVGEHRPTRGDRTEHVPPGARARALLELTALWLVTLLAIRGVVEAQKAGLPEWILAAVPFLFVYAPVGLARLRGIDPDDYRLALPAFSDRAAWGEALRLLATFVGIFVVPFVVGYHFYQSLLFDNHFAWRLPKDAALLLPYHLFFVAIPEEFFYRGYFQTRLNEVFPRKFLVFGTPLSWALPLACLYFAFGHSLVTFRWWHWATFFPGLAFGWLRERTGHPLAGALFHAWCNVTVACLDTWYGVI